MSKVDLASREWCDMVFEGRNKEYGAYRHRANKGKFQLRAIIIVLIMIAAIVAFILAKTAVEAALSEGKNLDEDQITELAELKKDEPKKEEPKKKEPELEYEKPVEKVAVKSSIQFTVPKIVEDEKVDHSKELKTQDEVTKNKFAIASQDYVNETGGTGINIDDLKENQQAGGTTVPPKEPEVVDNAIVEVPATYPGGEAALLAFVSKNLVYPAIAQEQELQGVVVLRFKVDVDGSVSSVKIEKSLSKECDQAAAEVVRKLHRFVPAKQQGHPVPVWFRLPVRFRIQ
ncbi:MAG: TonB family protein [Bacteroidales bacterium]|nr:TonB family protein [Bacteroidales bacterium]MCI7051906.1 TonB family protein [Bacteroidales bacterium]